MSADRRTPIKYCTFCGHRLKMTPDLCEDCGHRGHLVCVRYHQIACHARPSNITPAQAAAELQRRRELPWEPSNVALNDVTPRLDFTSGDDVAATRQ